MTRDQLAAVLSLVGAAFWIPQLVATWRRNTGGIDGGNASSTFGRDRGIDVATVLAVIGVLCAIASAVLLLTK